MKLKIRGLVFTGFAAAVFAQSAWALPPAAGLTAPEIDALKATVTSKFYVDSNYQDLVQKEPTNPTTGATTISNSSDNDHYPTSENVYKFVKSEIGALDSVANIQGDGTYVTVDEAANGNKEVQIITANLASANSDVVGTLTDAADQGKLVTASAVNSLIDTEITSADSTGSNNSQMPTSKAVYDFVTGTTGEDGFQPKISNTQAGAIAGFGDSDTGDAVAVGYKPSDGNGGYGNSSWLTFGARANGQGGASGDNHLSYLRVDYVPGTGDEREKAVIDIKSTAIAGADNAIIAAGVSGAAPQVTDKLATAKAVYQYAVPNQWDSTTQANKTLVTDEYGVVTVSNVPALPEINTGDPCKTPGVHCALVSSTNSNGVVSFAWTVMAGAEGTSNSGGGNQSGGSQSGGGEQGGGEG